MSDIGLLHYFLDFEVKQRVDGIFLSQRKICNKTFKKDQYGKL